MKVKAVIMRPDRTNDVVVLKKKHIEGKMFRHDNCIYFLDPDRFQITWVKRFPFKFYHITYYYTRGVSTPLPCPDFKLFIEKVRKSNVDTRTGKLADENTPKEFIQEITEADFHTTVNRGVSAEELASLFNPWFYRIIAAMQKDLWEQIQFYIIVGLAFANIYLIYLVNKLQNAMLQAHGVTP